jgi:predicted house-cleaning noncanonical NTP pyrophosphatase (MazG superfamily)
MLDPFRNIGKELADLINRGHYFVIHAARQSGKTTLLKELTRKINAENEYYTLYCSLEKIQEITEAKEAMPEIIDVLKTAFYSSNIPKGDFFAKEPSGIGFASLLQFELLKISKTLDKPLIIFFDEADCLSNGALISFLRQLRIGYINKDDVPFAHSIALVGMRNIRDYKAKIREDKETLGSASPFNIVTKIFNLENFTKEDVIELYNQHTKQTGQVFETAAVDYIFEQTQGQPWLVNAIAAEAIEILQKDYSKPITAEIAKQAIYDIVLARGTHFDSLMERLKEPRVRRIIQPLILGEYVIDKTSDDYLYTRDLGLIRELSSGFVEPANQIYAEIIIRMLSASPQDKLKIERPDDNLPKYIVQGKIDINALLKEFQIFWRENSEIWIERYKKNLYQYDEAAPHLTIQAFLQRVLNGGGHISREMALGKNRCDICIEWEGQKYPIELKLKGSRTIGSANEQILKYMASTGSEEGWIVMFDRGAEKSWDEKIYMREEFVDGKKITVVGC